nr:hypothetical protein [Tanacetum cinerariifolium]
MLYKREKKWIDDFVPMDSKKEEKKLVEPESKDKKGKRIKRVTDSAPKQKSSKKEKMMQEQESAKSDEEELANGNTSYHKSLSKKSYPLIKEMLEKMLNWKLEAEDESTMAFELLKFIKSHIEK